MNKLLNTIDAYISKIPMYRLVLYGLAAQLVLSVILSLIGLLNFSATGILTSLAVLFIVSYVLSKLFAVVFNAQANYESWLITAFILALILPPAQTVAGAALVALAGVLAVASKYLITYRHRHLFNPAAFAALVLSVSGLLPAIWWVGTPLLVLYSVIFGAVLLRKIRRYTLFTVFALTAIGTTLLVAIVHQQPPLAAIIALIISSPLIFFGTIMLTEPETMPNGRAQILTYGALVGLVISSQLHAGPVYATPEVALIIGNLFAIAFSAGLYKQQVALKKSIDIGSNLTEYVFESTRTLNFKPGQYMSLTLPHDHTDTRGNRRTFSLSSAPGMREVRIATKFAERSSSFKSELKSLKSKDVITLGELNGSFVLPADPKIPLVLIAGGIGITPFVSMARDMIARKTSRPITLFYLVGTAEEYAYQEVWTEAETLGLKVVPILTSPVSDPNWHGLIGTLTPELLKEQLPHISTSRFYISGPHGLVVAFASTLKKLGVHKSAIVTDFFSGY